MTTPYTQINDSLYELYAPATGEAPTMELVFFHGLYRPEQDSKEAFWNTWLSGDECWPQTWLTQKGNLPRARILSVSYDASVSESAREGRLDLHNIGENLVRDIICSDFANVGQTEQCPVFLIGHSLGGLVIKQLILGAQTQVHESDAHPSLKAFLGNLEGIFYFSTPHSGADIANFTKYFSHNSPLVSVLSILNAQGGRLNNEFRKWRRDKHISAYAVVESEMTRVGSSNVLVVSEASGRFDVDNCALGKGDHFTVCAPPNPRASSSLHTLRDFIKRGTKQKLCRSLPSPLLAEGSLPKPHLVTLPFLSDGKFVPLENTLSRIKVALEAENGRQVVTLYGGPGLGKSCLARYVALHYQQSNKHFLDGVCYMDCGFKAPIVTMYEELLQILDGEQQQSSSEFLLHQKLVKLVSNRSILIVLDNVWQQELLTKLLVPVQAVKYLITSQNRAAWKDSEGIRMGTPCLEEARQILGNYTDGLHLDNSSQNLDLQEQIDEIIREWDLNPSILASLAMAIDNKKALDPEEWKMASQSLHMDLIDEDTSSSSAGPVLYGTIYHRHVSVANNLNSLAPQAQRLLCVIALCDCRLIPEVALELFFNKVESQPARFSKWGKVLEEHSFIQMQNRKVPWSTNARCLWSMDKLARHVIKAKKKLELRNFLNS